MYIYVDSNYLHITSFVRFVFILNSMIAFR